MVGTIGPEAECSSPEAKISPLDRGYAKDEHCYLLMAAKVFISCGQASPEEQAIARDVESWFEKEGFRPFLAIEARTMTDLNRRVIEELKSSDYFVFINFAPEEVLRDSDSFRRGSVYTNQELSMAISLDFTDKMMILVNQRGAHKEGFSDSWCVTRMNLILSIRLFPSSKAASHRNAGTNRSLVISVLKITDEAMCRFRMLTIRIDASCTSPILT
jgi:hypothetical protein